MHGLCGRNGGQAGSDVYAVAVKQEQVEGDAVAVPVGHATACTECKRQHMRKYIISVIDWAIVVILIFTILSSEMADASGHGELTKHVYIMRVLLAQLRVCRLVFD